jgi:hypothetical protein
MTNGALGAETGEMSTAGAPVAQPAESRHSGLWTRQLPFGLVLILTVVGVAYTSFSKRPILAYWELLVPIIAIVCIGAGWQNAKDRAGQLRLIRTQALHWLAFLLVMNMMLLPGVQRTFNAGTTALAIFTLLALGTFTAGIHIPSWQIGLLGLIMALGIPALAWIENSALLIALTAAAVLGIAAVFWWHGRERGTVG